MPRRIVADVDGHPLWFESDDVELWPAPEAFACALLPAALARGCDLVVEAPLDPVFAWNVRGVVETFARWWGHPRVDVRSEPVAADTRGSRAGPEPAATALCFSGGADSFYSLLCGEEKVGALVFAHGFDIPLADARRADTYRARVEAVARAVGARAVGVRTNLRDHPVAAGLSWGRAHGGAMAALGHAIPWVSRLVVAASYPVAHAQPWGSRWDLDGFWSSSETEVVHHGADRWRAEKLVALGDRPLAREHLRVCLESPGEALNCSRCEKCIRTMLVLAQSGMLDRFPTLDPGASLAERIEGLHHCRPYLLDLYEGFLERERDPEVRAALGRLLARSRRRKRRHAPRRLWKRIRDRVGTLSGGG